MQENLKLFDTYVKWVEQWDEKKIDSNEFNFFHLISDIYGIGETKHSRFLAFILDPKGSHGHGKIFLNLFLNDLKIKNYENESWEVNAEKGSADVLIQSQGTKNFSIVIENKSNDAIDQENQLFRYWYRHIYRFFADEVKAFECDSTRLVYLTSGYWDKKYSSDSISVPTNNLYINLPAGIEQDLPKIITPWTFTNNIKNWLEQCLKNCESNRMEFFILDYIRYWDDTNNKKEFFMRKLENELDNKEKYLNALKLVEDINNLQVTWFEKFHTNLGQLVSNDSNFQFDSNKFSDFRWFAKGAPWNDLSFIYEPNFGFTIWKKDFWNQNKEYKEEFIDVFSKHGFEWYEDKSNYIMKHVKFDHILDLDRNDLAWKYNDTNENIIDDLKSIIDELIKDENVIKLFKEISVLQ